MTDISSAIRSRIFVYRNKSNIHSLKRREQGKGKIFLRVFLNRCRGLPAHTNHNKHLKTNQLWQIKQGKHIE